VGYPPKDYLFFDAIIQQQNKALEILKRKSKWITIVVGGITKNRTFGARLKNEAFILQNGQRYTYTKQLLPNYDIFDEHRYFEPGRDPLILKMGGSKCGFTICEDIWTRSDTPEHTYPIDPLERYKTQNIDLMINISASPFELGKLEERHKLLSHVSKSLTCPLIYVNQCGANDDLIFDGGAFIYNAQGQLIFQSNRFDDHLAIFDFKKPQELLVPTTQTVAEELSNALVLGIKDYTRKTGFKQVVLGLSGGIDSALVAHLATLAVGHENVLAVMLPSRYSSKGSITDAERLAKNLKIKTFSIKIDDLHKDYEKLFKKIFDKKVHDLTSQNIQARIRGNILMAISNNEGRLLLNTTNKSELAMGYGTLYGDLCGGLAVLADVTKTQVYELAKWINREKEIIPNAIITKAPSAELKPNQKDTDSLPPYEILDPWLVQFVHKQEVPPNLKQDLFSSNKLAQLIFKSEYKRFQSPLGLRVTSKAFGSGRRFPIAAKIDV